MGIMLKIASTKFSRTDWYSACTSHREVGSGANQTKCNSIADAKASMTFVTCPATKGTLLISGAT